ncbi:MAG: tRNA uracil 4-sulfurtransferase ThiI [Actinomycetota bacterium]
MTDAIVAHYHELSLKGRNRNFFEDVLAANLKFALRGTGYERVRRGFGRIVVDFKPDAAVDEAASRAAHVLGLAYIGVGRRTHQDLDSIAEVALDELAAAPFDSFAIRARRSYSQFPMKSGDINREIGQRVVDAMSARVDLKHPDATVAIELFGRSAIVYRRRIEGPGGLPYGVSGKMLALLSGGIDSPVAAYRMALRGAKVDFIHFHGQPYTDPSSIRQATELLEVLARSQLRSTLHLVPLADAQREIVMCAPAGLRIVLYRRIMMRIAAALGTELGSDALVTGDSLGQVASQTIENINTISAAVPDVQVLRPLIGMDKLEIIAMAQRIGTYDISTRKHQDCCVLFEPRDPATRASVEDADQAEADLDMDALVGKALAAVETRSFELPAFR